MTLTGCWSRILTLFAAVAITIVAGTFATVSMTQAQASECWAEDPSMDPGYAQWAEPPQMIIDPAGTYTATIDTNRGSIVVELLAEAAPQTVNNFVCLSLADYYDVTVFHRIILGFMIQGGDPTGTGRGGPGYQFADELPAGDAPYTRGTMAMANAGANTNGSQFFIVQQDQPAEFPANYSIFGQVVEGIEVVDTIASSPVAQIEGVEESSPLATLGIRSITITDGAGNVLGQEAPDGTPVGANTEDAETPAGVEAIATEEPEPVVNGDDDDGFAVWVAIGLAAVAGVAYLGWNRMRTKA